MTKFEELRAEAKHPEEIEFALWFHDAIYNTKRHDNEERSAEWARETAVTANLPGEVAERIKTLILATRHDTVPQELDEMILIDVDLSILGATPDRFDDYEKQIRAEYAWVPVSVFRSSRLNVLRGFLARAMIFNTRKFFDIYESQARANLERSIKNLRC
ncbi:MAG TPA: hypothetical protein VJ768_06800 [Anaerolineales bacterium]|nr:hypothetical protein [Anaerolineales bacterium]